MKLTNALKSILVGLYGSVRRFPVTLLLSAAVAGMLIAIAELQQTLGIKELLEVLNRITMILALGIPFSLCIKMFFERKDGKRIYELIIYYVTGAIILLLYYFFLLDMLNMVTITRYVSVNIALYLGFLFIPFLWRKKQFEMYIINIFTGFFITFLYSIVLYFGLSAILFTIDKLLAIRVAGKVYYYTALFVAFIFAPSYFLAGIPLKSVEYKEIDYPKLLRVLLLYIVMPLLTAYTSILYIYFGKIIITTQWPVGLVSHLVLWYSVLVSVVLFFITPLKDENKWASIFLAWLPKIIIPILVMMFISMGIRVNAYGITESRYYVIVLGLWILGVMLYYCFAKKLRNIILPFTLSIIALVSVFGPLSSYSISQLSQNNRFQSILIRNNMIERGRLKIAPSAVLQEDRFEISRILDYFNNYHSLKGVRYLPKDFKLDDMEEVFGFPYENPRYGFMGTFFFFQREGLGRAVDVSGYEYLYDARSLYDNSGKVYNEISVTYSYESGIIKINNQGNDVYTKDLKLFAKDLVEEYGASAIENILPAEVMTLVEENEKIKVKFIIFNIQGNKMLSTEDAKIEGLDFYMLLKIK